MLVVCWWCAWWCAGAGGAGGAGAGGGDGGGGGCLVLASCVPVIVSVILLLNCLSSQGYEAYGNSAERGDWKHAEFRQNTPTKKSQDFFSLVICLLKKMVTPMESP